MLRTSILSVLSATSFLAACSADNLYIAHRTNLGLNATYNQAQPSGKFVFGYKEQFLTVIPRSVPRSSGSQSLPDGLDSGTAKSKTSSGVDEKDTSDSGAKADAREAMAVLSCSDVKVGWLELKKYSEYLATGEAAIRHAYRLAGWGNLFTAEAAKIAVYDLRDKVIAATAAVDVASNRAGDTATEDLKVLASELKGAQEQLTALLSVPEVAIAGDLSKLLTGDLGAVSEKTVARNEPEIRAAGKDLQILTLRSKLAIAEAENSTPPDSEMFDCYKDSQNG